jgi:uncharacterized protein (UPF0264 family)
MIGRGLLVSVRDPDELDDAVDGGADIIDIKEPARGSMGRPDAERLVSCGIRLAGRRPWTFAGGELATDREHVAACLTAVMAGLPPEFPGPAAVKLGLSGMRHAPWQRAFRALATQLPGGSRCVADADAGRASAPDVSEVIAGCQEAGCRDVLIDTFDKGGARLFDLASTAVVTAWVRHARRDGLGIVLAGRIRRAEITAFWRAGPDAVALRSAVCFNGRLGRVSRQLVSVAAESLRSTPDAATAETS